MDTFDILFFMSLGLNLILCVWVMLLDSKLYDLKRYIEKLEYEIDAEFGYSRKVNDA